ncbi:MAG: hypothetical protein M1837_001523 [Sclerophora amabilis]|nr:MAG: hypothetical protein M1837_001523 [Sclerophora amabilis]
MRRSPETYDRHAQMMYDISRPGTISDEKENQNKSQLLSFVYDEQDHDTERAILASTDVFPSLDELVNHLSLQSIQSTPVPKPPLPAENVSARAAPTASIHGAFQHGSTSALRRQQCQSAAQQLQTAEENLTRLSGLVDSLVSSKDNHGGQTSTHHRRANHPSLLALSPPHQLPRPASTNMVDSSSRLTPTISILHSPSSPPPSASFSQAAFDPSFLHSRERRQISNIGVPHPSSSQALSTSETTALTAHRHLSYNHTEHKPTLRDVTSTKPRTDTSCHTGGEYQNRPIPPSYNPSMRENHNQIPALFTSSSSSSPSPLSKKSSKGEKPILPILPILTPKNATMSLGWRRYQPQSQKLIILRHQQKQKQQQQQQQRDRVRKPIRYRPTRARVRIGETTAVAAR